MLPGPGAKDKLSLRVHGLIVGSPDKKRADPAVLRALCSHVLPNGKQEVRWLYLLIYTLPYGSLSGLCLQSSASKLWAVCVLCRE